jgi:four helix bundle protein
LQVWKASIQLVKEVYSITGKFPATEGFGLTEQIRKAAVSIPSNIAEGQGRNSPKEFRQFLAIALGSVAEVETQLIIAREIDYVSNGEINPLLILLDDIRKMAKALANSLR